MDKEDETNDLAYDDYDDGLFPGNIEKLFSVQ